MGSDDKERVLGAASKHVVECLSLINDKVNAVIEHFPELREAKSSLARTEPQTCELSADGMAFDVDEPLKPDTKLALRFLFVSDHRYIETFCRVVREVEPLEPTIGEAPRGVAVEFHGMKTADRETLIQHLFDREAETLRKRRLKNDAARLPPA